MRSRAVTSLGPQHTQPRGTHPLCAPLCLHVAGAGGCPTLPASRQPGWEPPACTSPPQTEPARKAGAWGTMTFVWQTFPSVGENSVYRMAVSCVCACAGAVIHTDLPQRGASGQVGQAPGPQPRSPAPPHPQPGGGPHRPPGPAPLPPFSSAPQLESCRGPEPDGRQQAWPVAWGLPGGVHRWRRGAPLEG